MLTPLLLAGALVLVTPDLTCRVRNKQGSVVRSMARRALFLRMIGIEDGRVPKGTAVNHIVPLRCGGCDLPSNMELMLTDDWKARTGPERHDCGRHEAGRWEPIVNNGYAAITGKPIFKWGGSPEK